MRRSRGRRNVLFVVLAFVLVAALIVLARLRGPARVMPPQSAELLRLRFSKADNAFFTLEDALKLVPPRPFVDPRTTLDFPYGPMGRFTGIALPDDNADHVAWVKGCAPVVDTVQAGLKKAHLLLPATFAAGKPWNDMQRCHGIRDLHNILLAAAVLELKSANTQRALDLFRDAVTLNARIFTSLPTYSYGPSKSICNFLRQMTPEMQRQALAWLVDLRASVGPPRQAVEDHLRLHEAWKDAWREMFQPLDPLTMPEMAYCMARSGPARKIFAANLESILSAWCMMPNAYTKWAKANPRLDEAASMSFPTVYPSHFCRRNSMFKDELAVMGVVLAIEVYRDTHGNYPESLNALVPEFLPKLPSNTSRQGPFYYRRADTDYWFALHGNENQDPSKLIWSEILISPPEE